MAITTGSIETYAALVNVTGIYALDLQPNTSIVYLGEASETIQTMPSLSQAKSHPLTTAGVGLNAKFQPAASTGDGDIRPPSGILY